MRDVDKRDDKMLNKLCELLVSVMKTCVVCRQVHGAVIQCCGSKCRKVYHTMCAFNAGYYMEVSRLMNEGSN